MTPLSDRAPIVNEAGLPARHFLLWLEAIHRGVIACTSYTAAELANMTPTAGHRAFCSDSSVTTFNSTVAGGGSNVVPVFGNGSAWKVG